MFRFESLEIWKKGSEVVSDLCDLADELERRQRYRFAEQLRSAALSITNNIAEGSGSDSRREFASFLNYSRRSVFENANMVLFFCQKGYLTPERRDTFLPRLEELAKMINGFKKSL